MKKTLIVGATTNSSRYAFMAAERLTEYEHEIIPIGIKKGEVISDSFIKRNKPILGICGGSQLINVYFQGTLIQDINSHINHEQPNPRNETSHQLILEEKSYLRNLSNSKDIFINSAHHQAVDQIGRDLQIEARALDGVIEAFRHTGHCYCVGLQWHPEFLITDFDKSVIYDFTENVKKNS